MGLQLAALVPDLCKSSGRLIAGPRIRVSRSETLSLVGHGPGPGPDTIAIAQVIGPSVIDP